MTRDQIEACRRIGRNEAHRVTTIGLTELDALCDAALAGLMRKCTVYKTICPAHDFIHGAEAEELREGIEKILEEDETDCDDRDHRLIRLLDKVDARDSLAFLEATDKK